MINAPQPSVTHLFTIFRQIASGELRIPAFQREFVWKDRQILDLLTSVREQFPIGSLLVWNVDRKMLDIASHHVTAFPNVPETFPTNYVLDGMQRLSTLYGTFHYKTEDDEVFNVLYDLREKRFFHEWDRNIFNDEASVPLSALLSPRRILEFQGRLASLPDGDQLLDELLDTQAAFQDYMIPVVRIQGTDIERIVGIFERINSTGTTLDTVDFMRAITWNQSFDLNRALDRVREHLPDEGFELFDETVIKCVGLILGVSPSDAGLLSLRSRSSQEMSAAFAEFEDGIFRVSQFLKQRFQIESFANVPYEGQTLLLFQSIGIENCQNNDELDGLERWFWACGFNESLRGKPDHYVVRAVENWRGAIAGQIRGLEPRLRISNADFVERRFISGKALSNSVAAMFAVNQARSLLTGEVVPPPLYMRRADLSAFEPIFDRAQLEAAGLDIGPSPRIISNMILTSLVEKEVPGPTNWAKKLVERWENEDVVSLRSQFVDERSIKYLLESDIEGFLQCRAEDMQGSAAKLVYGL